MGKGSQVNCARPIYFRKLNLRKQGCFEILFRWLLWTLILSPKLKLVIDPDIAYNILQLAAFAVMAFMIMRLKLFLTPHLCLMASIIIGRKFSPRLPQPWLLTFHILLVGGMTIQGAQNVEIQRNVLGEYSNFPMEELLMWIKSSTDPKAVFSGPMPVTASILLSTRRPIVNHPHYEHAGLRERTKRVYTVFSRKTQQEVYDTLSKMHIDYVVLESIWCFGKSKKGCSMKDIWDIEDPENIHRPPVCPHLFKKNPYPFERVFSNDVYVVLKVRPKSQYVELHPPKYYKQ